MKAQHKFTISLAGSGNVGSFLAAELFNAGCTIRQIFSRTLDNARKLAYKVQAEPISDIDSLDDNIDLLIVALPDRIIPEFCQGLNSVLSKREASSEAGGHNKPLLCVASTAGSVSLNEFRFPLLLNGVLYPLQSFTMSTKPFVKDIPFCVEADDDRLKIFLKQIAALISEDVREINSEQRLSLHLAAVYSSNFSNHLFAIAHKIIRHSNLDFSILWPLINETINRLREFDPEDVQTGPAIRNDIQTIEKHLELLANFDDEYIKRIYQLISESIYNTSQKEASES